MFDLTNLIPQVAAAKTGLIVVAVAALFSGGLYCGYQIGSKALPEAEKAQQIDFTNTLQKRWAISNDIVPVYVDRIRTVRGETETLIKEVTVHVQDTCTLSPGLRLFHDAATEGHLPVAKPDHAGGSEVPTEAIG